MHVPRFWSKAEGELAEPGEEKHAFQVWGWGDDEGEARTRAGERLGRLLERLRSGDDPGQYEYAERPLREEILQVPGAGAVLTRNRYGAVVLNATGLLMLDVDLPETGGLLGRLFGKRDPSAAALERLRDALRKAAPSNAFRLYRTAAGLRVLGVDREFDPASDETRALMERTGTDPAFARLCRLQKSFRARLTPKPWRCKCSNPPGEYPRAGAVHERFEAWCGRYARAIEPHATCRYLETLGTRAAKAELAPLLALHDSVTRCEEELPLA